MKRVLRIATRRSELALWQAQHVRERLAAVVPEVEVRLLPLVTEGDRILDRPLAAIGGKGLFLKELERAMQDGQADLAVHSMKDVPVESTPGLPVCAVLERANPFDAVLSCSGGSLDELPAGSRVGTSSLRRQCQVRALRPDLRVVDLRGNVNTRIRRLDEREYDAIILACAGLERLGLAARISARLEPPAWLPAVSQGTIGIQCREEDQELRTWLASLDDPATALCTRTERQVSAHLEGSCQLPLAVFARLEHGELRLDALVGQPDGRSVVRSSACGPAAEASELAAKVAEDLRCRGADRIIAAVRQVSTA